MLRRLFLLALVCVPANVYAQSSAVGSKQLRYQYRTVSGSYNLLSGVALNASSATRTITLATGGYDKIDVCFQATRSAYTDVQVTPTCSVDGGTNYSNIPSVSISSGTGTNSAYHDVVTTSSSVSMCFQYAANNCSHMKFVFSGSNAGSSDLLTAQATAGVGR